MNPHAETPAEVAARIRLALAEVPAERLIVGTDCGLYQLRPVPAAARRRLPQAATARGRDRIVRQELGYAVDGTIPVLP